MAVGIPTGYRSNAMRSRLEARWAAFFDLIGWRWVYEPFDADGYIPDFLIQGVKPLLVEVGPCVTERDFREKAAKPLRVDHLATLVVGASPTALIGDWWDYVGMLVNEFPGVVARANLYRCTEGHALVFGDGDDGIGYPCGHHFDTVGFETDVDELWARAGSSVQWRP